jgi:hypothetical protein
LQSQLLLLLRLIEQAGIFNNCDLPIPVLLNPYGFVCKILALFCGFYFFVAAISSFEPEAV